MEQYNSHLQSLKIQYHSSLYLQINVCNETLCKYIENIVSNPTEEKYRKIRMSNKAFQERILPIEGTKEFLEAAGFVVQELPFNEGTDKFWVAIVFEFILLMYLVNFSCNIMCCLHNIKGKIVKMYAYLECQYSSVSCL